MNAHKRKDRFKDPLHFNVIMKYVDVKNVPSEMTKTIPKFVLGLRVLRMSAELPHYFVCCLQLPPVSALQGCRLQCTNYLYRYSAVRSSFFQVKCRICQARHRKRKRKQIVLPTK